MRVTLHKDQNWTLPTEDGKTIYGITNGPVENDRCIVMVHGLTGHMNEFQNKLAANAFVGAGYTVIRFNLYDGEDNGRKLVDCTLQTHAADVQTVLKNKTKGFSKIFLTGHSYGGPSVMIAQPVQAAAICLWDPSFNLPLIWTESDLRPIPMGEYFTTNGGVDCLKGKAMVEEGQTRYNEDECLALSEKFGKPIRVLIADQGFYMHLPKSWHDAGHSDNDKLILKDTDHCFWRDDSLEQVIDKTLEWFDRY